MDLIRELFISSALVVATVCKGHLSEDPLHFEQRACP
jgi:hypothetical protein